MCSFSTVSCCLRRGIRCVLFRTPKTHLTSARPGNSLPLIICQRHNDIIESGTNVCLTDRLDRYNLLLGCFFTFSHFLYQLLFGSFLLVSHGLPSALTGTGVILGSLATYWKMLTMTQSPVTANIHQAFNVQLDFRTKSSFDLNLVTDDRTDSR